MRLVLTTKERYPARAGFFMPSRAEYPYQLPTDYKDIERVFQTSRPHKAGDFLYKARQVGMPARVYNHPVDSPEKDGCPTVVGPGKLLAFNEQSGNAISALYGDELWKIMVIMDVAGYIISPDGLSLTQITSCRGQVPTREKLAETAQLLYTNAKPDGTSDIMYVNTTARGLRHREISKLTAVQNFPLSAILSFSPALIYEMGRDMWWDRCARHDQWQRAIRPAINPASNASLDMGPYVGAVRDLGNRDTWIQWSSPFGVWRADGTTLPRGMRRDMDGFLRGFPMPAINFLANMRIH